MKLTSFVLAASAVACAAAAKVTRCGTADPPATLKQSLDQTAFKYSFYRNGSRTVNTYVHVVTTEEKDGAYTQANVDEQMQVMNAAYGPSGFSFNLLDTDFTVNDEWAAAGQGTQAELDMKSELHQGTYADLNIYFLSDLGGGLLGFCYFPEENPTDEDLILDGCINIAGSLPGLNELPDYNLGLTAVHEAGHWFGLFHVFQGSACTGKGDYISDTPAQSAPTEGCPTTSDTCPDQPGVDSIHNYMDYSYDACLDEFTQRQGQRMFSIYDQYRAGK